MNSISCILCMYIHLWYIYLFLLIIIVCIYIIFTSVCTCYSCLELLDCVNVCCVGIDCFTKAIGLTSRFHTIIGGHQFSAGHSISYSTRRQNTWMASIFHLNTINKWCVDAKKSMLILGLSWASPASALHTVVYVS